MNGYLLQGLNLFWRNYVVGLGYHHQEVEQLQALLVHHVGTNLMAAVVYHAAILLHAHALLLLKELEKYLLALFLGRFAEVLEQEPAHQLHLRMHNLAIHGNDIRRQYQKREHEAVALALVGMLLAVSLLLVSLLASSVAAVGFVGVGVFIAVAPAIARLVHLVHAVVEE